MKTIFKIHPFFYIFAFICMLTGYFKNFIFITTIILIHEMGHIISSIYYRWKIEKIVILPFGGIVLFNEKINKPLKEEFIITIMGPLFQCLLFLLDNKLFKNYNLFLLIFNLIPIMPLDGSKLLNILFNKIIPFKKSHILSIIVSILLIIFLFINSKFNLISYIILFFLIKKIIEEIINHKIYFSKFLLERYLYKFNFKRLKKVDSVNKLCKDCEHLIFNENKYITERTFLHILFDK